MDEDDDLGFVPVEPAAPQMRQRLATELDPVQVEGAADGTGTTTMGAGGRYVFGDEYDASAAPWQPPQRPAPAPVPPTPAEREREQRVAAAADVEAHSPWWDTVALLNPFDNDAGNAAGARFRERGQQFWDQYTSGDATLGGRNPIDPIAGRDMRGEAPMGGAVDTLAFGMQDEAAGVASRLTGGSYREGRDAARARDQRMREQAPSTYTMGMVAGAAPLMALPGAGQASAGIGAAARGALAVGQGAQLGAMSAFGHSDASLMDAPGEVIGDTLTGGAIGGALGGAGEAVGSLMGAARRGPDAQALARGADDSLLAATGHAGSNRAAVERFDRGRTHDAVMRSRSEAARVLRETGAVPPLGTMGGTARSIEAAQQRATGVMDDVRTAMGGRGPTGADIAERLRARAAEARGVTEAPVRSVLSDFAERYGDDVAEGARPSTEPLDYDALMRELRGLRQAGSHRTRGGQEISLREEGLDVVTRGIRDSYDDAIEAQLLGRGQGGGAYRGPDITPEQRAAAERLGMDPVEAYRGARRQYAVLDTAMENARRGEAAVAGNRLAGMSEMQWGGTGATAGAAIAGAPGAAIGGMLGVGAARGLRAIEPRLRATGAAALHSFAREYPHELARMLTPQVAQQLAQAASRSPAAFATALHMLSQRDADVRELAREFEAQEESQ